MLKIVILMGGESSRFWPLNYEGHKALFKVMGKSILEHTLDSIKGISKNIVIVKNKNADINEIIKKYNENGFNISVIIQEEPKGMGDALLLAKKHINSDDQILILNPYHTEIKDIYGNYIKEKQECLECLFGVETEKPEDYGILEIKSNKVIGVEEKPQNPKSNIKIVGIYYLNSKFLEYLEKHKDKGHYFFEYALDKYLKEHSVDFVKLEKEPVSLKYSWQLFDFVNLLLEEEIKSNISEKQKEYNGKNIVFDENKGNIFLGNNVKIMENVVIRGPAYIGNNVVIGNNSLIRNSVLEDNVMVGFGTEIARSVLSSGVSIHSGFIGDSIIGKYVKIGADFTTSNKRLDRANIKVMIKGKLKDSGRNSLGVIIGKNTNIGIKSGTMPGVLMGNNCIVYPGKIVYRNVEDNKEPRD